MLLLYSQDHKSNWAWELPPLWAAGRGSVQMQNQRKTCTKQYLFICWHLCHFKIRILYATFSPTEAKLWLTVKSEREILWSLRKGGILLWCAHLPNLMYHCCFPYFFFQLFKCKEHQVSYFCQRDNFIHKTWSGRLAFIVQLKEDYRGKKKQTRKHHWLLGKNQLFIQKHLELVRWSICITNKADDLSCFIECMIHDYMITHESHENMTWSSKKKIWRRIAETFGPWFKHMCMS